MGPVVLYYELYIDYFLQGLHYSSDIEKEIETHVVSPVTQYASLLFYINLNS